MQKDPVHVRASIPYVAQTSIISDTPRAHDQIDISTVIRADDKFFAHSDDNRPPTIYRESFASTQSASSRLSANRRGFVRESEETIVRQSMVSNPVEARVSVNVKPGGHIDIHEDDELASMPAGADEAEALARMELYFSLCFLYFCAVWPYEALFNSQDIYTLLAPLKYVPFIQPILYHGLVFLALVIMLFFPFNRINFSRRVVAGFGAAFLSGGLVVCMCSFAGNGDRLWPWMVYGATFLSAAATWLAVPPVYALATLLNGWEYTAAVQIASGGAGLLSVISLTLVRIAFGVVVNEGKNEADVYTEQLNQEKQPSSSLVFFGLVMLVSAIAIFDFLAMIKNYIMRQQLAALEHMTKQALREKFLLRHWRRIGRINRKMWYLSFKQCLLCATTYAVLPGVAAYSAKSDKSVIAYRALTVLAIFELSDFLGKLSIVFSPVRRIHPSLSLFVTIARTAFVPILVLYDGMAVTAVGVVSLGYTHGILTAAIAVQVPGISKEAHDVSVASQIFLIYTFLGSAIGAALCYVFCLVTSRIPLPTANGGSAGAILF